MAPSLRYSNLLLSSLHHLHLILTLLPPSYKDPCDYPGLSQIIQNTLSLSRALITPAESILPYKITYSLVSGIWIGTFWGDHCFVYQSSVKISALKKPSRPSKEE
jgi:hypothetical protein